MSRTTLDTAAMDWSPSGWPGVSTKVLDAAGAGGGMTGLTRLAAGATIPAHRHTHADQSVFVVEGDLIDGGASHGPGSYIVVKAGTPHGPHRSAGGCVLLTTYTGPVDFVAVD